MLPRLRLTKGASTVTVAVLLVDPTIARIVASPGLTPRMLPAPSMVATWGVSLDQVTEIVDCVDVAVAFRLPPTATEPGAWIVNDGAGGGGGGGGGLGGAVGGPPPPPQAARVHRPPNKTQLRARIANVRIRGTWGTAAELSCSSGQR